MAGIPKAMDLQSVFGRRQACHHGFGRRQPRQNGGLACRVAGLPAELRACGLACRVAGLRACGLAGMRA